MDRKKFLTLGTAGIAGSVFSLTKSDQSQKQDEEKRWQDGVSPWPICLDTATIRPASLDEKVNIAAEAGYDAIEPWDGELAEYEEQGGNLKELGSRIKELGLFVPSVIGLWNALPPADLGDEDRVFPGDGILPLPDILKDLYDTGFKGCLSLELYNPEYYERDLFEVAREGLQKTLAVIGEAGV